MGSKLASKLPQGVSNGWESQNCYWVAPMGAIFCYPIFNLADTLPAGGTATDLTATYWLPIFRSECKIGEKEGSCSGCTRWRSVTDHLCWKFTIRGKRINVEFTFSTISWLQKKELCSSSSSFATFFSKNQILWNLIKWANKSRPLPSGGKAFIDFAEPQQAASAKTALQGFKVTPEKAIQLTFAKN